MTPAADAPPYLPLADYALIGDCHAAALVSTGGSIELRCVGAGLCLSCKGCKGDCPVNVDMATYKAEFLLKLAFGEGKAA